MIIDTRIRPPYKGFAGIPIFTPERSSYMVKQFGGVLPQSVAHSAEYAAEGRYDELMAECFAEMDTAGIDFALVPGRKGCDKTWIDNQILLDLVTDYPERFGAIASVFPEDDLEESLAEIQKYCVDGPFYGVSMETAFVYDVPTAKPRFVDDEKFWPIYEFCEKNNVIMSFTHQAAAYPDFSGSDPMRLDHIFKDFPKLKVILVHGAWPYVNEYAAFLMNHKNVMIQPDFYMMNTAGWQGYVQSINYMNPNNYVFSSSYPLADMKCSVDYYLNCGVREEVLPNLMYKNAAAFFDIDAAKVKRLSDSPVKDEF